MTRRIAIDILVTTLVALVIIGAAVYLATGQVLLADLDESIINRAMSMPAATAAMNRATAAGGESKPMITGASFTMLADGVRVRSVTLLFPAVAAGDQPVTVTARGSAARYDFLLNHLLVCLVVTGLACGSCAAMAALILSRAALRPLVQTADAIGEIDERRLDRRIDAAALPPELRPMADRLNELLERLELAFEQRSQFLATASHELRTPVAAMLTTVEVALRRPRAPEALVESLKSCLADAMAMRQLVDGLMQQVRSESRSLREPRETFDLARALDDCAEAVARALPEKNVEIVRRLPVSLMVRSETGRLRSIATNLLANAVEYTQAGGRVELVCQTEGDGVVITVSDNGPGIAADLLPKLFEPFVCGQGRQGHLGLGLALVKAHVRALDGRCEAGSAPGGGAIFRVWLPLERVATEHTAGAMMATC
jgi:signal transduction histidine kinase